MRWSLYRPTCVTIVRMCGRYVVRMQEKYIRELQIYGPPEFLTLSYNVAPTQSVPVVRCREGRREGSQVRWEPIPFFARGEPPKYSAINARIETLEAATSYAIPGGEGSAASSWESAFTVVQWDQPRAGVTFAKHGAERTGEFSVQRLVRDGLAVVEFLRLRRPERKIILLAFSGGTILGLHLIKHRPEWFAGYVATGQIVNWAARMH